VGRGQFISVSTGDASTQPTFEDLQMRMVDLATRVESVDIRRFESHPPAVLAIELAPLVQVLVRDAQQVVLDVARTCETETRRRRGSRPDEDVLAGFEFERALDAAVEGRTSWTPEAVGDIAFLAGIELRQRSERLAVLAGHTNHEAIIGECDSTLRRIRKALTTIDRAFERASLAPAQLDFTSELHVSLEVRRTYAKLQRRVKAIGVPSGDTFYVQLRAIGTALATVVGWKGYSDLRVRDRMQLRELQRRLLAWFRTDRDLTAGHRLWQDLDNFIQMLVDVNHRQELKEHDKQIVEECWPVVVESAGALPPIVMQALERLEGLDEELDVLLASEQRDLASAWRGPLERVRQNLVPTGTP
jgi:hypothetical protein